MSVSFKLCSPSLKLLLLSNYSQSERTRALTHIEWGVSLEPDRPETVGDPTYTCKFHNHVPDYTSSSVLEGIGHTQGHTHTHPTRKPNYQTLHLEVCYPTTEPE